MLHERTKAGRLKPRQKIVSSTCLYPSELLDWDGGNHRTLVVTTGAPGLEIQSQAELEDTPTGIVSVGKIAVCAGRLAEAGTVDAERGADSVAGCKQEEVGEVERIQGLHPELEIRLFSNLRLLDQAEIPLLLPRTI